MAYLVKAPRVGRSQGAVIFWGLVSAFFAAAFCYYYLENRGNEDTSRKLLEQVMILQSEHDSLSSERDRLVAATGTTEKQLHERADFLQEKETKLAQEESAIESAGTQTQSQISAAQAVGVKKFDDTVRKLVAQVPDADVIVRGGRPVLRMPNTVFFDAGATQLKTDGKSVLNDVAQAVAGSTGRFELRVETFTDSDSESHDATTTAPSSPDKARPFVDAWTLTADRAAAISHFLRDSAALPFQNVIAMGRADSQPIEPNSEATQARNRRVEITITPVPGTFHAPELKPAKAKHAGSGNPTVVKPKLPADNAADTGSP